MIGSLDYGGSQMFILSILEQLHSEGIVFDFIIDHPEELQIAERVKALGSRIFVLPAFKGYNIVSYLRAWNSFFQGHPEYNIIHGHVRSTAAIYLSIAKKYGLFTIAHSHSTNSGEGVKGRIKNAIQYFIRFVADYFMACSDEAGEWLFGTNVVKTNRYMTVFNGIDYDQYKFNAFTRDLYRDRLGIKKDDIVIGHVGRFNEAKNHIFLINVFNQINKKKRNTYLLLIGNTDKTEYSLSKKAVEEFKLQNSVIFLGPSNEINNWLNVMDCFVFPSKWEGFGIAALESQANGLKTYVSATIPHNIAISDNILFLPLTMPAEEWATLIIKKGFSREKGAYDSRYDIKVIAKKLSDFYRTYNAL